MNTDNESLSMTDAGSEFQTDGAAHRKEPVVDWFISYGSQRLD